MKRTLLVNANYEPLTFLTERRVFKFIALDKVESISSWDDIYSINNQKHYFPAVLRLKKQISQGFKYPVFSKENIIRRDRSICQFCAIKLEYREVTIDHILPKSRGGKNSFTNCVVSCFSCNNKKGNQTPEEAGMKLLKQPENLCKYKNIFETKISSWHEDWNYYYDQIKSR